MRCLGDFLFLLVNFVSDMVATFVVLCCHQWKTEEEGDLGLVGLVFGFQDKYKQVYVKN